MKITLTKDQSEALESALDLQGCNKANVVEWHATNLWDGKRKALNGMPLDTLIRALYVGYEVEPSPDEKIAQKYKELQGLYTIRMCESNGGFYAGKLEGIRFTLDTLNVKVKGVNC